MNKHVFRGLLPITLVVVSFVATLVACRYGFRWDEDRIACAGRLIAQGAVPYRDFGFPAGPLSILLQAVGHFLFPDRLLLGYGFMGALLTGCVVERLRKSPTAQGAINSGGMNQIR